MHSLEPQQVAPGDEDGRRVLGQLPKGMEQLIKFVGRFGVETTPKAQCDKGQQDRTQWSPSRLMVFNTLTRLKWRELSVSGQKMINREKYKS